MPSPLSVQSLSHVWHFMTPWIAARQASLSITNSSSLLKLMPIGLVMPSSRLILCRPLLLLPPIPPSIRVFSNESALPMKWPKYWSFSFSISPANEQRVEHNWATEWNWTSIIIGSGEEKQKHLRFGKPFQKQRHRGTESYSEEWGLWDMAGHNAMAISERSSTVAEWWMCYFLKNRHAPRKREDQLLKSRKRRRNNCQVSEDKRRNGPKTKKRTQRAF